MPDGLDQAKKPFHAAIPLSCYIRHFRLYCGGNTDGFICSNCQDVKEKIYDIFTVARRQF